MKRIKNKSGNRWKNEKGQLHRVGGPAVILPGWGNEWWFEGVLHRIDGPAVEWWDGRYEWAVRGKWITELVDELLAHSYFPKDVHLGIFADYWAERGDFRLLDIVQPYLVEKS